MKRKKTKKRQLKIPIYKINKILVPIDGSKNSFRALNEAINLATKLKSKITGLYVIPMDVTSLPLAELFQPLSAIKPIGYKERRTQEGKSVLELTKKYCNQKKVSFAGKILEGNPGDKIVKFAQKRNEKFDWIIMGSRGMGHPKEIFLGSVSHYVINKTKIPVLIVK